MQAARQRRRAARRSADAAGRRAAAERRAAEVRGAEALGKRQWTEAVTYLRQAHRAGARQRVHASQSRHRPVRVRRRRRRARRSFRPPSGCRPALPKAHYGVGIVIGGGGSRSRSDRRRSPQRSEADPAAVEARMSLADALRRSGRDGGIAAALCRSDQRAVRPSHRRRSATRWHSCASGAIGKRAIACDAAMKTYPDQPGFAHALARLLAAAPDDSRARRRAGDDADAGAAAERSARSS